MKRVFNLTEVVRYEHAIEIEAESEEILDDIISSLECDIEEEVESKEHLFETIKNMSGSYKFIEDGSPYVEFDYN